MLTDTGVALKVNESAGTTEHFSKWQGLTSDLK